MQRIHIALGVENVDASIEEYNRILGVPACVVVAGEYALWRTQTVNFSIRRCQKNETGTLRHLGWEDECSSGFKISTDVNGIVWEHFSLNEQLTEIKNRWQDADIDIKHD